MGNRASPLEVMVNQAFWSGKRVFITGHTGFKGGWLSLWLHKMGANVVGYALPPPTTPSFFVTAGIENLLESLIGDIRDRETLSQSIRTANPEIIFHLAAQSLVSEGYRDPVGTYETNVTGTLNLLEAVRPLTNLRAVVIVTTDKCYENRETSDAYREGDPLGGYDPYSASKACTEIITHAWRRSFFGGEQAARIATARAGNAIGGGDWTENRLIPDLLRAFATNQTAEVRHPEATRPWQHVLEPLAGYLTLAESLFSDHAVQGAWNFGPALSDCVSVGTVADQLATHWPKPANWHAMESNIPHEAGLLILDSTQARKILKWRSRWPLTEALRRTVDWQQAWLNELDMQTFSKHQIDGYIHTSVTQ